MTQKDLDTKSHLLLFSKEEIDQGYNFCNDTMYALRNRFPGHTFVGIPDTIVIKELGKEVAQAVIDELQEYINSLEEKELWENVANYVNEHTEEAEEPEVEEKVTDEQQQL